MASQTRFVNNTVDSEWANPDNAFADDDACTSTSTDANTNTYDFTNNPFTIPDGATITGLYALFRWGGDGGDIFKIALKDALGVLDGYQGAAAVHGCADASLAQAGGDGDLWFGTYTPAHINSANFQCAIQYSSVGKAATMYIDFVEITVYYTFASADLFAEFVVAGPSGSQDLLGEFIVRHDGFQELLAHFILRQPGWDLHLRSDVDKGEVSVSTNLILISAEDRSLSSSSVDLPGEFIVRHKTSEDLPAQFTIRHTAAQDLFAEFIVRQESYQELFSKFDISAIIDAQEDLFAKFIIRHTGTEDLFSKFVIRHSASEDLYAEFDVSAIVDDQVNLFAKFTVRHAGLENLFAEFLVINRASVDLFSTATIRHSAIRDLEAEAVIRHSDSVDVYAKFTVRQVGSSDLKAILEVKNRGYADLYATFRLRQDTEDLFAKATIRQADTAELFAEFTIRQPGSQDLFAKLIVRGYGIAELLADFYVRQPSWLWTSKHYLEGVVNLKEQPTVTDAVLEYVIEGVMVDVKSFLINNELPYEWDNITTVPKLIKRATTYGTVASLFARGFFSHRLTVSIPPRTVTVIPDGGHERAMDYWEDRMMEMLDLYSSSVALAIFWVSTADEEPVFSMEDVPMETGDPYKYDIPG